MRPDSDAPPPADFERIQPRRPVGSSPPGVRTVSTPDAAARVSAMSFWIAAGALAVIAALVFLLLPRWVSQPSQEKAEAPASAPAMPAPAAPAATPSPAAEPAAPESGGKSPPVWDDAALLEARAAAQAARTQYDEQLARLMPRGVQSWGAAAIAKAQAQAATGAKAFTDRDFPAAKTAYEAAAAGTAALLAQIRSHLSAALAAGNAGLNAGDKLAAQQAFEQARTLDPDNAAARRGLERVVSLDAVRVQVQDAQRLEQSGDTVGARAAWKQALALDPDTPVAREALARLDAKAGDAEFRRALGEALHALDRGNYDVAEKRIARARALRANDPGVQQASARLAEARRGQKLAALEKTAAQQAAAEDWPAAVASYRAAQQLDGTVAFARDGLTQAEPRAALAQKLQDLMDRPERLSAGGVLADAERSLQQARAISPAGPRLSAQIANLERLVAGASTPVEVTLSSDGKTEVTIYKVGSLGRFTAHSVPLKPGHYAAAGVRAGYRDVRVEFDVIAGAAAPRPDVRCEEAL